MKLRDPVIASAVIANALSAAIRFDAFERFAAWVRRYDERRIDELTFSYRRGYEEFRRHRELYQGVLAAQSELGEGLVVIEDERVGYANDAFCEISA